MENNAQSENMVSKKEAEEEVVTMAKRMALLYYHTAEVLTDTLGEEEGKKLLHEIIKRYGHESGAVTRARVEELGLPLTAENFNIGSDLPKWGWESDRVVCEDGVERARITYCPLAEVWREKGSEQLGRIYCYVDQAKYDAYNGIKCKHQRNVLDGDDCCLFDFE